MTQQLKVYFGTYNSELSKGIYRSNLDAQSGELSAPELVAEAPNPSFLAISPNGQFLYAALEDNGGAVGAWRINDDETLTPLNRQSSQGSGCCHVWVDAIGKNVLVANYSSGSIACFPVQRDGSLGACSSFVQHTGSGPDARRQEAPHAHAIYTDPANKFVYACDLGTDEVLIYRFDAESGTLTANDPPAGKVPPGGGPRHFAMHPGGFAYTNNEMSLSVTAFKRETETGALTEIQTIPTLEDGTPTEGASTAEMFIHPNGKCLYVSNRGPDTITTYAIAADGTLSTVNYTPTPKEPRGFGLSADGQWLVVAGQNDDSAAVYAVDAATGMLQANGSTVQVGKPVCVLFAP
jgi:6-phosphogluconolactonase